MANFAAFGSWPRVLPKNAESLRNSDALMRVAVPRRRGPAGLRGLFSPLSKLEFVHTVPDTSFGFPTAPACAVPVQALFQLALFQPETVSRVFGQFFGIRFLVQFGKSEIFKLVFANNL